MRARWEELARRGRSRLVARPATPVLLDAFDRHYEELLGQLTALSGSPAAAEAAIDEAFRRAALDPVGFEQMRSAAGVAARDRPQPFSAEGVPPR